MQLTPGIQLQQGKYVIIRSLGQGGFGITYEAEQVTLHRNVAVKEFFMKDCCERDSENSRVIAGTGSQRELVERFKGKFLREAQMIAGMEHPNIVRVTDVFEENGTAYYVMEKLPGGSLAEKVKKEGPLSEIQAEKYIRQVADALSYIHARNTVHLDVKPSNILLDEKGDAILIDFGISKHYDESGQQTSSTPVGNSKGYAPLEQSRDGDVRQFKPSTDIYALGASLYHLITGQIPPEASIVNEDGLTRPNGISDRIWTVIENSMRPRRKDRPQSIPEFLSLLNDENTVINTTTSKPSSSTPNPIPPKMTPMPVADPHKIETTKSRGWLWAIIVGLLVLVVVLVLSRSKEDNGYTSKTSQTNSSIPTQTKPQEVTSTATNNTEQQRPLSGRENGHEWVDLGLSVKWATCNLGASTSSEYGSYIAWAETTTKSNYTRSTLRYRSQDGSNSFTKYSSGDNRKRLEMSDDAARSNWGGRWRLPTKAEFDELVSKCTWTWTSLGGKNGYMVKGANGMTIFLPAGGDIDGTNNGAKGMFGSYWSSSLNADLPDMPWCLNFGQSYQYTSIFNRYNGFTIRPVWE